MVSHHLSTALCVIYCRLLLHYGYADINSLGRTIRNILSVYMFSVIVDSDDFVAPVEESDNEETIDREEEALRQVSLYITVSYMFLLGEVNRIVSVNLPLSIQCP